MACFSVVCNNGFLISPEKLGAPSGKNKCLERYRGSLRSSLDFPSLGFYRGGKSQHGLSWNNKLSSLIGRKFGLGFYICCKTQRGLSRNNGMEPLSSGHTGDKQIHVGKRENDSARLRKRFSLRLRPRLRLLSIRLKMLSIRSILNDIGTLLRKNIRRVALSTSISIALGVFYLCLKLSALPAPKVVPYSDLILSLQNGSVTQVLFEEGSRRMFYNTNLEGVESTGESHEESPVVNVTIQNKSAKVATDDSTRASQVVNLNVLKRFLSTRASSPEWHYSTRKIDRDEKFLLSLMREKGVKYSSAPQSVLTSMRSTLITVIFLWIPLIPLMWLLYRQLSSANSPARKRKPNTEMVGFDDVEGVDAAKVELMEIVSCLQGDVNYQKLGAKLPRGVLLVGPPGTGKTLLARAVAGEAGVPFFPVSASEFVELFVGRGAARIRDLFSVARKCAPSIIFIDELDAVGGKRGRSFNDERDQTLNQLLTEMDGFESDMKVVVIAATNRPEALDPALCRPGRFSRKVLVGEPDIEGRKRILAVHLRGVPLEDDTQLICDLVASLTPGFVGADLANIVNEAALLSARRGSENVSMEDVMQAIERAKFGINDKQLRRGTLSKELGKLFPWIPSLVGRNDTRQAGLQGPLGYQTFS
ncbi:probable inactive ATP-dependent zinc metalloprotease FTSHI 3, chloroplastic [Juglans microcarpa x Juglans regia]|uniref:probable inactive ATP-dependent zinc metalloprotease FTSHI 3, chloroplastic n=1 Tax=Juglans microcarpa x Juglans regia TaxID=2249226 RepID=UPI001B7EC26D|nr:probable inactive ATP-dependent zinc metalloprotease FTSHI 3, chloroplastic [Juglans microcarpa x Juglans regia]